MVIEAKVNETRLKDFNAHLLEYPVGPCEFSENYMLPDARIIPVSIKSRVRLRTIDLKIDFEGETAHDIALSISKFTAELSGEVHLSLPDGFQYWCAFTSASTPKEVAPWIQQATFSFVGFRHIRKKTFKLNSSCDVFIEGNVETPAIVKITPGEDTTEVTFNGITITNLENSVTIDGVYTTVKDELGANKFADTNMTEWPKLYPGSMTIGIVGNATVEVSYYPIYL